MTDQINFNFNDGESIISFKTNEHYSYNLGMWSSGFIGHVIETTHRIIRLGISNGSSCCEQWDSFVISKKPIESFVERFNNHVLLSVEQVPITPELANQGEGLELLVSNHYLDSSESLVLKLTIGSSEALDEVYVGVYNIHNGYYGHAASVEVFEKSFNFETSL